MFVVLYTTPAEGVLFMDEQRREFTGVWIPKEVLLDKDLSDFEKILYAEIASFGDFWMSNKTLALRYKTTERNITICITSLRDKGYVEQVSFDGRKRHLVARHIIAMRGPLGRPEENFGADPKISSSLLLDNNEIPLREESRKELTERPINSDYREKPSKKTTPEMQQVFSLFSWNPARVAWKLRLVERNAAQALFDAYGLPELERRLKIVRRYKDEEMCPQIDSPSEFLSKMTKMERFLKSL